MSLDQDTDTELVAPGLSSIYDTEINVNDSIYEDLSTNIAKHSNQTEEIHKPKTSTCAQITGTISSMVLLGLLGIFYNLVGQHIHDNHILVPQLASKPLDIGYRVIDTLLQGRAPTPLIYAIEGVFLGCVLPLFDKYVFKAQTSKGFVDNSSIVRSSVAFLGVAFAVRKIEWASSIQAAVAWSLLSPCVWLLLDGTLAGFTTGVLVAAVASSSVAIVEGLPVGFYKDEGFIATMLWLGNFFFFGLIIFGKIGRYLFEQ
jgi:hypothetical protein